MSIPYIGITDFTELAQVDRMLQVLEDCIVQCFGLGAKDRVLHVGVMMSRKSLRGIPSKWTEVFPPKELVANILSHPAAYNCLHYADYDGENVRENLTEAIYWGGPGLCALQLDMVWPDPRDVLDALFHNTSDADIILQVNSVAMERVGGRPEDVVAKLAEYRGVVSRILLDRSMGRGLGMDAGALLSFVRAIAGEYPDLGIGVAGGLGPGTVQLAAPILREFPEVSIDAQGKLRPSGSALDPIDWNMAEIYLREAFALCCL